MLRNIYFGIGYLILMAFFVAIGFAFYVVFTQGFSLFLALFIFNYFLSITFALVIFVRERHNNAKVVWLFLILILPILSCILYLVFGQRYKNRKNYLDYFAKESFKYEQTSELKNLTLQKYAEIAHRGIYPANVQVFKFGDEGYAHLFADLLAAKSFIFLQYYIIKPGEIYEQFKQILLKKAAEGVEVKLIVDDFGHWAMPWYELKALRKGGVEVAIFGPVHFPFLGSDNGYRTHRKMAVIDGLKAHVGGINIADDYAHINKKYGLWIDYQVSIEGPILVSFILLFIEDWKLVTKEDLIINKYLVNNKVLSSKGHHSFANEMVLVEDSPENTLPILQDVFVSLVANAKRSVKIVTPYLVLTPELKSVLRSAALSGVKVCIYIPGKADKKWVFWATELYAMELSKYGVEIKVTRDTLVHSKFGIFDDEYAYFGTPNWDFRSFYSQFEFIVIAKGQVVHDLNHLTTYYDQLTIPYRDILTKKSWIRRKLRVAFVNLLSPVM